MKTLLRIVFYPVVLFNKIRDYLGALNRCSWYIEKEFAEAGSIILGKEITCVDVINKLKSLRCLPDLKGFDSIITLLRHRHRTRAYQRLQTLQLDWVGEKISFKEDRRGELTLIPDESEETQA